MINALITVSVLSVLSFLAGSFPSAYIAARIAGKGDIRTLGSGNLGATNTYRTLGLSWAIPVLTVDFLKGFLPVILALGYHHTLHADRLAAIAAGASVLGHVFSPWTGFRGGKGVATGSGAVTALMPLLFPVCLAVFLTVLSISRRMSMASLSATASVPIAFFSICALKGERPDILVAAVLLLLPVFVFASHTQNIVRLRDGTEPRLF